MGPGSAISVVSHPFQLNNDEIKAWPTTPLVVIPSTETLEYSGHPASLILPVGVTFIINTLGGAYGNIDNAFYYQVNIGSDQSDTSLILHDYLGTLSQQKLNILSFGWLGRTETIESSPDSPHVHRLYPIALRLEDNLEDNAVVVGFNNAAAGNLTGGHVDNYIKGEVLYRTFQID